VFQNLNNFDFIRSDLQEGLNHLRFNLRHCGGRGHNSNILGSSSSADGNFSMPYIEGIVNSSQSKIIVFVLSIRSFYLTR
jgi:hypothetical protein